MFRFNVASVMFDMMQVVSMKDTAGPIGILMYIPAGNASLINEDFMNVQSCVRTFEVPLMIQYHYCESCHNPWIFTPLM